MRYIIILLILTSTCFAKQTICLNMIVKDESDVIIRCLESIEGLFDYWVIVDTGSTDDTISKIQRFLKRVPGELYQRPWKNFGANRSEAFNLAKGKADYILFMDADDILVFSGKKEFPKLTRDCYMFWAGTENFSYLRRRIVRADIDWQWIGVTHEYIQGPKEYTSDILENVKYVTSSGGYCSKELVKKFLRNIALLEEELKKDPTNLRNMFYLAESYRDAQQPEKALACYQKRIAMKGWSEEVFWSHLQTARLLERMAFNKKIVEAAYLTAYEYRKKRIEPVYFLAKMYNRFGEHAKSYALIEKYRSQSKEPRDILFNMDWITKYGLLFEYSIAAYHTENYQIAKKLSNQLLESPDLPEHWQQFVINNLALVEKKLEQLDSPSSLSTKNKQIYSSAA